MVEFKAVRTNYTIQDLKDAAPPGLKGRALTLFIAHQLTESADLCVNFNVGNVRPRSAEDFTRYACGEELPLSQAKALRSEDPDHVLIVRTYGAGSPMASVKFLPPHPYTRFRSFPDLSGAGGRFAEFLKRYTERWRALMAGDVARYNAALVASHYYTADADRYLACLQGCMGRVERDRSLQTANWPVMESIESAPQATRPIAEGYLSDEEITKIEGIMALTARSMLEL